MKLTPSSNYKMCTLPNNNAEVHTMQRRALKTVDDCMKKFVVGTSEAKQKAWCIKRLRETVESFDTLIPIIGPIMDIPIVDDMEQNILEHFVDWAWETVQACGEPNCDSLTSSQQPQQSSNSTKPE